MQAIKNKKVNYMSNLNLNFYENPLIQPLGESEASNTASNSNGANILIEQLYKFYGEVKVLEDLDLNIQAGEFVAIVGRSGCGKSTLLRLIAQLEKPAMARLNFNPQETFVKASQTMIFALCFKIHAYFRGKIFYTTCN
jgi:sulfonate transport system ATP-binding protein